MYNRAEIIDKNFKQKVRSGNLPQGESYLLFNDSGLSAEEVIEIFESQVLSRQLDLVARELKTTGDSFYTIGSSGHEGNAAVAKAFDVSDMAFLHYRSGAFFIQRARKKEGSTPVYDILLSLVGSSEDPIAGGRHKVWGSKELFIPPQTSTIASHLPKAIGMALSIGRAFDLGLESYVPKDSAVLCSFGDASANHSTAQGAINCAAWVSRQNIKLPLVFICEDNGIGISVPTDSDWIEDTFSRRKEIKYFQADGKNILDVYMKAKMAMIYAKRTKKPVFLHLKTVRLLGHAGSDVETNYHSFNKIEMDEGQDPLLHSARILMENNILSGEEIVQIYEKLGAQVRRVALEVKKRPKLNDPIEVESTIRANMETKVSPSVPGPATRAQFFGRDYDRLEEPQHMAKLINWALTDLMLQFPQALIFGEDVAKKGGVYNVTDQLHGKFGSKRVFNSLLDEQSILGAAIGFAHNGFLPIPEIQFLAYVHNAEDQIRGEAATLAFFSKGQFVNPMVIRVAGLGYQKGFGGHFHNDNSLAVFRDIPGLVIGVPSNGADAVKMLRTCAKMAYEQGRVVVFVEPIALYMTKDLVDPGDKRWSFKYPSVGEDFDYGKMGVIGKGDEFAVVTYGNGVYLSSQALDDLSSKGYNGRIVDLRWLSDIDPGELEKHLKGIDRVLIVDECRKTGSVSEQLASIILEKGMSFKKILIEAGRDCFVPLGPAAAAGMPSRSSIANKILELMEQ